MYCDGGELPGPSMPPARQRTPPALLSHKWWVGALAGCSKRFKPGQVRWCCSSCDFDVCEACTLDVVTEQADTAAAEADEVLRKLAEMEQEEEEAAQQEAEAEAASKLASEREAKARAEAEAVAAAVKAAEKKTPPSGLPALSPVEETATGAAATAAWTRACSGCGRALSEEHKHPGGLLCTGGCEGSFVIGQSRWSCARCKVDVCSPCLLYAMADASSPDLAIEVSGPIVTSPGQPLGTQATQPHGGHSAAAASAGGGGGGAAGAAAGLHPSTPAAGKAARWHPVVQLHASAPRGPHDAGVAAAAAAAAAGASASGVGMLVVPPPQQLLVSPHVAPWLPHMSVLVPSPPGTDAAEAAASTPAQAAAAIAARAKAAAEQKAWDEARAAPTPAPAPAPAPKASSSKAAVAAAAASKAAAAAAAKEEAAAKERAQVSKGLSAHLGVFKPCSGCEKPLAEEFEHSGGLICDGCSKTFKAGQLRLSCHACDFDLCSRCARAPSNKKRPHAGAAAAASSSITNTTASATAEEAPAASAASSSLTPAAAAKAAAAVAATNSAFTPKATNSATTMRHDDDATATTTAPPSKSARTAKAASQAATEKLLKSRGRAPMETTVAQ